MDLNEFIKDALNKEQEFLLEAVRDLTPEELSWRAGPQANPIVWILWHMFRVEDMWIQFFIQNQTEIWEQDGWHQKFSLPTRDNGFGHNTEQISSFPYLELSALLNYGQSVRSQTIEYLGSLGAEDYNLVPRERRSEMSIGAVFQQIVGEFYQHLGHISYLKGLVRSGNTLA